MTYIKAWSVWPTRGPYAGLLCLVYAPTAAKAKAESCRTHNDIVSDELTPADFRARRVPALDGQAREVVEFDDQRRIPPGLSAVPHRGSLWTRVGVVEPQRAER